MRTAASASVRAIASFIKSGHRSPRSDLRIAYGTAAMFATAVTSFTYPVLTAGVSRM